MLLIPRFVNGTEAVVKISTAAPGLVSVVERVRAQGKVGKFEGLTRFPRIPKGSPMRDELVQARMTADKNRRCFSVILSQSTETPRPTHVELFVAHKDKQARKEQEFFFLAGLDGALLEAGFVFGPLDEKGKVVPGPALTWFESMDIKAPETRALFQREMDFWVKGVGRKSPDKKLESAKSGKSP